MWLWGWKMVSGRPTREGGRRDEREERAGFLFFFIFYFIKIIGWEATVLPNGLGSTVASQQKKLKIRVAAGG